MAADEPEVGTEWTPMTDADELVFWRRLAQARGRILAAYRTHTRTPVRAIDEAHTALTALKEAGKYQEWK